MLLLALIDDRSQKFWFIPTTTQHNTNLERWRRVINIESREAAKRAILLYRTIIDFQLENAVRTSSKIMHDVFPLWTFLWYNRFLNIFFETLIKHKKKIWNNNTVLRSWRRKTPFTIFFKMHFIGWLTTGLTKTRFCNCLSWLLVCKHRYKTQLKIRRVNHFGFYCIFI